MINTPIDVVLQPFTPLTPSQAGVQTISAEFPARYAYWDIDLDLGTGGAAITPAMLQEIRLKANGLVIQRIDGTSLDSINQYYKAPAAGQVLSLMQRRLGIRGGVQGLQNGKLLSGSAADVALESILNTGSFNKSGQGISALIMEIDVVNTPAGVPIIKPQAQVTDPFPGGAGLLRFLDKTQFNAVSGQNTLSKANALLFGDPNHSLLDAVHIFPSTGTLDSFQWYFNNNLILQRSDAFNRYFQQLDGLRTPQAGMYTFEWSPNGYGDEVLNIADPSTDMRVLLTTSAQATLTVAQYSLGYPFGRPDGQ